MTTPERPEHPERIGEYTIHGVLGRGGMGIVYEAEQSNPTRRVALKVIRGGQLVDEQQVRLFKREVQALARLRHPGIATIYESGRTDDGHHYFAMELVRGEPLDLWIKRHAGTKPDGSEIRRRLRLTASICEAVAYAHRRGVIHRDLKPSNVIVLPEDAVKIFDFGLARITESDVKLTTFVTEAGVLRGTLPYMSPEQFGGDPDEIDVRADVYSLGVLLYELLTGALPYEIDSKRIFDAPRIICEQPPISPARRMPDGASLDRDVQAIVLKALEKEPERRYGSATALAEDIERYLDGAPVLAVPPSSMYQLRKLIGRHKLPFTIGVASVIALAVLAVGMTVQARRATFQKQRADLEARSAQRVVSLLEQIFEEPDPFGESGAELTARDVLDRGARRITGELQDAPEVQARLFGTLGRVYRNLGAYDEASTMLDRSLDLRSDGVGESTALASARLDVADLELLRGHPDEVDRLLDLVEPAAGDDVGLAARVGLLRADRLAEAGEFEAAIEQATAARDLLCAEDVDSLDCARGLSKLAHVMIRQGRPDDAEPLHRRVLEIREARLGPTHALVAVSLDDLAGCYQLQSRYDDAEAMHRRSLELREQALGADHPVVAGVLANLAELFRMQERFDEALPLIERSIELRVNAFGTREHPDVGRMEILTGDVLRQAGRYDEAIEHTREGTRILTAVYGRDHERVAEGYGTLSNLYFATGDLDQSERLQRDALEIRERVVGPDHGSTNVTRSNLAAICHRLGRYDESERLLLVALESQERQLGPEHLQLGWTLSNLGMALIAQERLDEARPHVERALAIRRTHLGERHTQVAASLNILGKLNGLQENYARAFELYAEALEMRESLLGPDHPAVRSVLRNWAGTLREAGRDTEAAELEQRLQ